MGFGGCVIAVALVVCYIIFINRFGSVSYGYSGFVFFPSTARFLGCDDEVPKFLFIDPVHVGSWRLE